MMILAAMNGVQLMLAIVLILVCLALMVIILLQRGRGGGVAAAFGGGGGGSSAFGAKTGDVFTLFTVILVALYLTIAVAGNYLFVPPEGVQASAPSQLGTQPGQPTPAPAGGPTRTPPAPAGDNEPTTPTQPETPAEQTP